MCAEDHAFGALRDVHEAAEPTIAGPKRLTFTFPGRPPGETRNVMSMPRPSRGELVVVADDDLGFRETPNSGCDCGTPPVDSDSSER